MNQQQLQKIARAFKLGFYGGTILSFMVYVFARILFYEFTFTAWEEISNFIIIIASGGMMVSAAMVAFLLLEITLKYLSAMKISFPSFNFKRIEYNNDLTVGSVDDIIKAA